MTDSALSELAIDQGHVLLVEFDGSRWCRSDCPRSDDECHERDMAANPGDA